jgi:hypothetical protein
MVVQGSGFGQKSGTQHFRMVFLPDEKTLTSAPESQISFVKDIRAPDPTPRRSQCCHILHLDTCNTAFYICHLPRNDSTSVHDQS